MPLARLRPFSHLIFDLDGVLLDTAPAYAQATDRVLARFGVSVDEETHQSMWGRSARENARWVTETFSLACSVDQYLSLRQTHLESELPLSEACPGAERLVRALARSGVRMGVATTSARRSVELKTASRPWFACFAALVAGDDAGVSHPKPAPDVYLRAAAELGALPECCVAFEDSPSGLQAAAAAGMQVVQVGGTAPDVQSRPHIDALSDVDVDALLHAWVGRLRTEGL